jgi:hypothetical protein
MRVARAASMALTTSGRSNEREALSLDCIILVSVLYRLLAARLHLDYRYHIIRRPLPSMERPRQTASQGFE